MSVFSREKYSRVWGNLNEYLFNYITDTLTPSTFGGNGIGFLPFTHWWSLLFLCFTHKSMLHEHNPTLSNTLSFVPHIEQYFV